MFLTKLKNLLGVLALGSSIILASCDGGGSSTSKINGHITGAENQVVYIEHLKFAEAILLDSATVDAQGKFSLNIPYKEEILLGLKLNDEQLMLVLDADNIDLTAQAGALQNAEFSGSKGSSVLKGYTDKMNETMNQLMVISQEEEKLMFANASQEEYEKVEQDKRNQYKVMEDYLTAFIDSTSSLTAAIIASSNFLNDTEKYDYLEDFNKSIDKRFKRNDFSNEFSKLFSERKLALEMEEAKNLKIGQEAPDFTLPQKNGNTISLKDYRGQYVLIDFWASWCMPCRNENPNVVNTYHEFKDKNFTVFGVSIDEDKDAWLKAVQEDQLVWDQVIDMDGWKSKAIGLYNVTGIPSNFLIDPDGKIVATNLRGDALKRKLAEVIQ